MQAFPCSGEINFKVADAHDAIERVMDHYSKLNPVLDYSDGTSADFGDWRFNLRSSNTEPLLRLNVESRRSPEIVDSRVTEITSLLASQTSTN